MTPPRIVLDTNACLDLIVFADPRVGVLDAALRAGTVVAVTRADCRDEWRRVLHYPALQLDAATRARCETEFDARIAFLDSIAADACRPLPRCAEADDQKFLELALHAGASALLTRDKALLALARRVRRDGLFDILDPRDWTPDRA